MNLKTVVASLFIIISAVAANATGDYIARLDRSVSEFERFHAKKEAEIDSLKAELRAAAGDEAKYYLAMDLYRAYQTYTIDSAMVYVNTSLDLARRLGNNERMMDTQIAQAYLYLYTGMYMEAHEILNSLDVRGCSKWLQRAYYHLGMNLY